MMICYHSCQIVFKFLQGTVVHFIVTIFRVLANVICMDIIGLLSRFENNMRIEMIRYVIPINPKSNSDESVAQTLFQM